MTDQPENPNRGMDNTEDTPAGEGAMRAAETAETADDPADAEQPSPEPPAAEEAADTETSSVAADDAPAHDAWDAAEPEETPTEDRPVTPEPEEAPVCGLWATADTERIPAEDSPSAPEEEAEASEDEPEAPFAGDTPVEDVPDAPAAEEPPVEEEAEASAPEEPAAPVPVPSVEVSDTPEAPEPEPEPEKEPVAEEPGPIPTAIVGYGSAGRNFHSYLISIEPGLELTAISTRDPARREAAAAAHDVKTYKSINELLNKSDVQLVVIATPHDTHEELAVKAMDAGRHVVVDKALSLTTAEADNMIAAAERNNVMLSIFHNRRWDGDYLTLRKMMDSGMLGEVFLIEECVMGYGQPGGWRGSKAAGGGPLYDWGAHLVDHAVQLAGCPPEWVFCETKVGQKWTTDAEEYVKCLIKFRSGLLYTVEVGYLAKYGKPKFFVLGTEGGFRKEGVDPQERFMFQKRIQESQEDPEHRAYVKTTINGMETEIRPETVRGDWCAFYRNIAAHLSSGVELAVKPEDVRVNIQITEAAMRSAQEGQAIRL